MKNRLKWLYNPFERIAGWKAFLIGGIIVCISVVIAYYGGQYYQGALNVKLIPEASLGFAFLSQGITLLCMTLLFFIAGSIFSKGVRFQDVLGTTTLARYPYIIPAFFGYFFDFDKMQDILPLLMSGNVSEYAGYLVSLTIIGLVMLVILVWYIALLWNAFRVSTDIKGAKGVVIFIIVLIMTDILYYSTIFLINSYILI